MGGAAVGAHGSDARLTSESSRNLTDMAMGDRPGRDRPQRHRSWRWTCRCWPATSPRLWLGCRSGIHSRAIPRPLSQPQGITVTREVIRAFMGYASSLRIPEFRSLELVLDDICKRIMPPIVRALDVEGHAAELGGVPGILYVSRQQAPRQYGASYLHGGGYIGTSPTMYAFFTARVCQETGCAVFVADYRLAPEFPYPAGAEDASAIYTELVRHEASHRPGSFWPATRAVAGWPTRSSLERIRPDRSGSPGSACCSSHLEGRPSPRRGFGDGQCRPRHPALEHPDGVAYLHGFDATKQRRLTAERRPERVSADLRHLGRGRDVPATPSVATWRACAQVGRGAHRRT